MPFKPKLQIVRSFIVLVALRSSAGSGSACLFSFARVVSVKRQPLSGTFSHIPARIDSCAKALSLRCLAREAVALAAGYVLKKLLDEVDVGEDHAAAAVALEADGVEGVTKK